MEHKPAYDIPIMLTLLIVTLPLLLVLLCVGWVKQKLFPLTSAPLPSPEYKFDGGGAHFAERDR